MKYITHNIVVMCSFDCVKSLIFQIKALFHLISILTHKQFTVMWHILTPTASEKLSAHIFREFKTSQVVSQHKPLYTCFVSQIFFDILLCNVPDAQQ